MKIDEMDDIKYFVTKIKENKNDPVEVEKCCRIILLMLDACSISDRNVYNIDCGENLTKEEAEILVAKLKSKFKEGLLQDEYKIKD